MDNQHKHIKGYRELTAEEIALMNAIKTKGEELEQLLAQVDMHVAIQLQKANFEQDDEARQSEQLRLNKSSPHRWIAIARTDMQTGLMALTRAVAQPTTF